MQSAHRLHAAVLLFLALCAVADALPASASVSFVGEFSNIRYTSEHEYGYCVELWRSGNELFGFLNCANGLAGDTPTGLLDEVHFDAATGALSFTAKLSLGWADVGNHQFAATHDYFTFRGRIQNESVLSGTLTHKELWPGQASATEHLRLIKLARTDARPIGDSTSYGEWRRYADQILKFRGPKW